MSKIRVVHHSKTCGFSGTDRTSQLFCKYLAQGDKYEPFLVYRIGDPANTRLDVAREWLGEDHVVGYHWEPGKKGRQAPYLPEQDNLHDILRVIDPDIVHIHRSGYEEWPGFKYMYPKAKWVETNIFGYNDPSRQMNCNVYISEYIKDRALDNGGPDGPVLYNPIEQPCIDPTYHNRLHCANRLRNNHGLPKDSILIGRVGRADNFDPISLKAFKEIEARYKNVYYLVVNPCQDWHNWVERLGIKNVRFLSPIINDMELSSFYMGLDIYAHARHDGECCPCNIQEAMMHGLPVVSHESGIHNGQSEIIGDAGFVVPFGDHEAYRDVLISLIDNPTLVNESEDGFVRLREYFAKLARGRAMRNFEASIITGELETIYDQCLKR